jgi:hypothetical protein
MAELDLVSGTSVKKLIDKGKTSTNKVFRDIWN